MAWPPLYFCRCQAVPTAGSQNSSFGLFTGNDDYVPGTARPLPKFSKYSILLPVPSVSEAVLAYDPNFYRMYGEYLKEDAVRASHNLVFDQFQRLGRGDLRVVDLDCGLGEF